MRIKLNLELLRKEPVKDLFYNAALFRALCKNSGCSLN